MLSETKDLLSMIDLPRKILSFAQDDTTFISARADKRSEAR
jgi:hypothetical protein